MRRYWMLLVVFLVLLSAIVYSVTRPEENTLVFSAGGGPDEVENLRALLDRFAEQHPDVPVTFIPLPNNSDEQHRYYLTTFMARSLKPDVVRLDVIWLAEFIEAGWLLPLDRLAGEDFKPPFIGIVDSVDTRHGTLYAVPWFVDVGLLYYRKDLLERYHQGVPTTWSDLVGAARAVCAAERTGEGRFWGYLWQGKQYEGLVCNFLEVAASAGGRLVDEQGRPNLVSPANEKALQFMVDLVHSYRISPPNTYSEMEEESSRQLFQEGRALFLRNWPYAWSLFERSPLSGKVGVSPLPHFAGNESGGTLGGWHLAVNARSRRPAAAWKLVRFLTSEDVQRERAVKLNFSPTRKALYTDWSLRQANPLFGMLLPVVERPVPRPLIPGYRTFSTVLQRYLNSALARRLSPAEALRRAQEEMTRYAGP